MHQHVRLMEPIEEPQDPVLVIGLAGGMAPGGTAMAAVKALVEQWGARPIAEIDPEPYFDFTAQRPLVRLEGGRRIITWPENRIYLARPVEHGPHLLLLPGVEPALNWRSFTEVLLSLAQEWGVSTVLTMRVFPALVPHTRPTPVRVMTDDEQLAARFSLEPFQPGYEGPTDILNVIEDAAVRQNLATGGLIAMVPHYLGVAPQPLGMLALAELVARGIDADVAFEQLRTQAADVLSHAEAAMRDSDELRDYVRSLEQQYDALRATIGSGGAYLALPPAQDLPPADELAEAVERFFAERSADGSA